MRRLAMVLLGACSSSPTTTPARETPQARAPVAQPVADATPEPVEPEGTPEPIEIRPSKLAALQQQLGDKASTCEGVAVLLASQGTATETAVTWRKTAVKRRCIEDKWPAKVRDCVASADHDQLSCTAYFTTQRQRDRWNAVFDKW